MRTATAFVLDNPPAQTGVAIKGDVERVVNNYRVEAACTCTNSTS